MLRSALTASRDGLRGLQGARSFGEQCASCSALQPAVAGLRALKVKKLRDCGSGSGRGKMLPAPSGPRRAVLRPARETDRRLLLLAACMCMPCACLAPQRWNQEGCREVAGAKPDAIDAHMHSWRDLLLACGPDRRGGTVLLAVC